MVSHFSEEELGLTIRFMENFKMVELAFFSHSVCSKKNRDTDKYTSIFIQVHCNILFKIINSNARSNAKKSLKIMVFNI
jgi:hypothetical protein